MDTQATFVGRKELLAQLLRTLEGQNTLRADVVTGCLGMGKSRLLRRAEWAATDGDTPFDALYVDLAVHESTVGTSSSEHFTLGDALSAYEQFSAFVTAVISQLAPEAHERLASIRNDRYQQIQQVKSDSLNIYAEYTVGEHAVVTSSGQTVNIDVGSRAWIDGPFIAEIQKGILEEVSNLVSALNGRSSDRPVLLLLDNVDAVAGQEFGCWLSVGIKQLEGAVVVLAHEPGLQHELTPGVGKTLPVLPLTVEEVKELLELRLLRQPIPEGLDRLLHEFSGGVPIAMDVLIDLLNDGKADFDISALEERLVQLPQDPCGRLNGVVTTMVEHYEGRSLGTALRAASVPVECDVDLLSSLLSVEGVPHEQAGGLLKELEAFSFTSDYTSPVDGLYYIAVHPFIRGALAERMRKYAPADRARYHAIVADYYYQKVVKADSYGQMFALEDPQQQYWMRKWLSHIGQSGDTRIALLQSARIFFDAMWWWGNYVELDFCEKLVSDFEARAATSSSTQFVVFSRAIRRFLTNYPFRARLCRDFQHGYPHADWELVQNALLEVQQLCRLVDMPKEPSRLEHHVAALLDVFMAHCFRYASTPDIGQASACYRRAERNFRQVERWWDVPWVIFEAADLAFESGDVDSARTGATAATTQLYEHLDQDDPDEELVANLHRLLGDLSFAEGDVPSAAREYGRAVIHSYLFHRIGGPPDDYTMQFYYEIRGRAMQLVERLWAKDDYTSAMAAASEMHCAACGNHAKPLDNEVVAQSYTAGDLAALAAALFPRGPQVDELGLESSAFMSELLQLRNRLGDSLDNDLLPV